MTVRDLTVTFALISWNQEKFIREAVLGAFAQTYSQLQIVLSDDASTDRTFEIMQDLAAQYAGPHQVVLNRNPTRLGIGGHVNRLMDLTKGEVIVIAEGDDISLPHRTERIASEWLAPGRRWSSLYSDVMMIDADGEELGVLRVPPPQSGDVTELASARVPNLIGCSHAWSRNVFEVFGPILPETVYADRVLAFRGLLLGGIQCVDEMLVRYRVHAGGVSRHVNVPRDAVLTVTLLMHERNTNVYENYLRDLETASRASLLEPAIATRTRRVLTQAVALGRLKIAFLSGTRWQKLKIIARTVFSSPVQAAKWTLVLLFPRFYEHEQAKHLPGL